MTITIREFSTATVHPAGEECELILRGERQELLDLLTSIVKPPVPTDESGQGAGFMVPFQAPSLGGFKAGDKVRFKDSQRNYVLRHLEGEKLEKALGTLTVDKFKFGGKTIGFKEVSLGAYPYRLEHVTEKPAVQYVVQDTCDDDLIVFGEDLTSGYDYLHSGTHSKADATTFPSVDAARSWAEGCGCEHLLRPGRWHIKAVDEIVGWD